MSIEPAVLFFICLTKMDLTLLPIINHLERSEIQIATSDYKTFKSEDDLWNKKKRKIDCQALRI